MKEYLLLIRGGDDRMATLSDAETQEHMKRWTSYLQDLANQGHLIGGLPLQQGGYLMTKDEVREEMVLTSQGESVGGWLHLQAKDYDQAVSLAKSCPIFEHNGSLEVREVIPMEF